MVKLRTGPGTCHIKSSQGPDVNRLHFYCSRYSTEFGQENFKPRVGRHVGTGYSSNFRPQLYYSRSQDNFDNPVMGFLLSDNYETITKRHYRSAKGSDGRDPLPTIKIGSSDSGFVRERPLTVPMSFEVSRVLYDTRKYGGRSLPGIPPRHKPILHTMKRHDPTEEENYFQGPKYMSTEIQAKFRGVQTAPLNIHHKDVGPLEETGFTDNKQIEPVTFTNDEYYDGDMPVVYHTCPTEKSVTKVSFRDWHDSNGRDPLPVIADRSNKDTGFIREKSRHLYTHRIPSEAYLSQKKAPRLVNDRIKKNDHSEYLNMKHPHNKKSVTIATYEGKQKPDLTETKLLNREDLGDQEPSGHSLNNYRYIESKNNDTTRYLTDYNMRFHNKELQGVDREGWVMGGLQHPEDDGYRRDFKVHTFGKSLDASERIRRLEPYVAKTIRCKDKFFVDYTHERKIHTATGNNYQNALSTGTLKVA
ncbi:stabilizer of axonemal microtubules 4-like [Styela clava]|nr:protein phosphatase 1 regulatory subunit 32-like isoform X2 [Styela clava]